jgi:hypothetical protein
MKDSDITDIDGIGSDVRYNGDNTYFTLYITELDRMFNFDITLKDSKKLSKYPKKKPITE